MKLLITTQTVDTSDSDLGFFVRWIEEFAKHCEKVMVVCLRKGEYSLPDNVEIIELGKTSRVVQTWRLWRASIKHQRDYDAVFVHMNPEYIIAAGPLWRLMHKKIALWYTHKSVNLKLRIATLLADTVFTASKESFRVKTKKLRVMGHGIDTNFFSPDADVARGDWFLSVGRLMKSKRHDLAIRIAASANKELRIVGEGPEQSALASLAREQSDLAMFLGPLTQGQLRDEYRKAGCLLHTSETGSLDKVVLEAIACGCPVTTRDPALKYLETVSAEYVRENHSLQRLVPKILSFF